jgi:hypothetical protein
VANESLYEILGVDDDASATQIRAAHRRLLIKVHPDQGGSDALCRVVQDAYETLADPSAREAYDAERRRGRSSPGPYASAGEDPHGRAHDGSGPADDGTGPATDEDGEWVGSAWWGGDEAAASPGSRAFLARMCGLVAARPSLVVGCSGLLALWIGVTTQTFGLSEAGLLLAAIGITGLLGRRSARLRDNVRRSDMDDLDWMPGVEFEHYLVHLFVAEGYAVRHTGRPGDYGADLLLRLGDALTVVQAKRTATPVGVGAVQEAVAARPHYSAQAAMVVTTSYFTPNAEALAASNSVELWDRNRLAEVVIRHSAVPAISGASLWVAEFRQGLPVSARFTWWSVRLMFWIALTFASGLVAALEGPAAGRSRSRRRRR